MRHLLLTSLIVLSGLTSCNTLTAPAKECSTLTLPPELSLSQMEVRLGQPVNIKITVPSPQACGGYETWRVATYFNTSGRTLFRKDDSPLVFETTWTPLPDEVILPPSGVAEVPIFARADTNMGTFWAYPKPNPMEATPRPSNVILLRVTAP
jgi:hypothetical protein